MKAPSGIAWAGPLAGSVAILDRACSAQVMWAHRLIREIQERSGACRSDLFIFHLHRSSAGLRPGPAGGSLRSPSSAPRPGATDHLQPEAHFAYSARMASPKASTDLSVRSESVQRLYSLYLNDRFQVNRRYQRKLVWSVEEKQRLIDSMLRDLPIPLFLVAESDATGDTVLELIDGLQRLNAIFAFLQNEFPVNHGYFDLASLADTLLLKDRGALKQEQPVLSRDHSTNLANYSIALSVFRAVSEDSVEEVFRRINSGGRRLSRQGLRQSGTISLLADQVRIISSRVRGDTSPGEIVPLRLMPRLSITNYKLDYGVNVDDIFWVQEGILRREDVRSSLDEQLVLDILIDILIEPLPNSGTRIRDEYYSYTETDDAQPTKGSLQVNTAIEAYGAERLVEDFMRVYDELRAVLATQDKRFSALINAGSGGRSPRYLQGIFLAFYELMMKDHLRIKDYAQAATCLTNIGSGPMQVPGGGGDWSREKKRQSMDAVKGVLRSSFEGPVDSGEDFGRFGGASFLENILGNALVEQPLFESKQGFYTLEQVRTFDSNSLTNIAQTMTAMANAGPKAVGYVVVGIADSDADVARIQQLDGVRATLYRGFRIVGFARESSLANMDLNDYWHWIIQKLQSVPGMDSGLAKRIGAGARLVAYRGLVVGVFKVQPGPSPTFFNGKLVDRVGSATCTLARVTTCQYSHVSPNELTHLSPCA
jgi:hypothetical protein